jgi:eukaryotic-like serine/threonine-protein kinase
VTLASQLGKYELLERIGGGGFGSVYRARDPALQREVAVKTCEVPDAERRARFFREAKLAARLHHPNIVTIFDFDGEHDVPYLVQELLRGQDLVTRLRDGPPLALAEKLRILDEVAAGLEHAHGEAVVHRDVKSANILVTDEGPAKILDFGIAKGLDDDASLTRPDVTVGSAGYMSPEQIEGDELDHRTDIFSLGVVAYELFSGRRPFEAPTLPRLFERILHEEPTPLGDLCPQLPAPLQALVLCALSKDPNDRPQSAAVFRRRLGEITGERDAPGAVFPGPPKSLPAQ